LSSSGFSAGLETKKSRQDILVGIVTDRAEAQIDFVGITVFYNVVIDYLYPASCVRILGKQYLIIGSLERQLMAAIRSSSNDD